MITKSNEDINAELIGAYLSVLQSLPKEMAYLMAEATKIKNEIARDVDHGAKEKWRAILSITANTLANSEYNPHLLRIAGNAFSAFSTTAKYHLGISADKAATPHDRV